MTTNFMSSDWKIVRSKIDMATLGTADDALNMADLLYTTMVHNDTDIVPLTTTQNLGSVSNPWEQIFTTTINTGSGGDPLTIQPDLSVENNISAGGNLNIGSNSIFLGNMAINNNFTLNNGNLYIINGNGIFENGNVYVNNGSMTINNGIVVNHNGMVVNGGVNMHNSLTVNGGFYAVNSQNSSTLFEVDTNGLTNAHYGLNVQGGTTTDSLFVSGQTTGGLYPIQIVNSALSPYSISTTITSFSDNLFLINNNIVTQDYNIVLPALSSSQYGAHLTIGSMVQITSYNYIVNTQGATVYGIIGGGNGVSGSEGTTSATIWSTHGYKIIHPYHGDSQELIFTPVGWLVRGFVANGQNVASL